MAYKGNTPRRRSSARPPRFFFVALGVLVTILFCFYYASGGPPPSPPEKVTIVITSYQTIGLRPTWLKKSIDSFLTEEFKDVVDKVILVWNAVDQPAPENWAKGLTIIAPQRNSLNSR